MNAIKAVYNFIVGDMIILIGILVAVGILALINNVEAFAPIRSFSGAFLIVTALIVLVITLNREARGKR
ncbi:MAG: hypothetical protein H0V70_07845 [Ktedonobacteraceae bacterium]|nr:hypothetical protein [Ktedonobacteraceae bacterium]